MTEAEMISLLDETLFQYHRWRMANAKAQGRRFVHYTSAPAAISIIEKQEIWLRNSAAMNDYSEVQHGHACIEYVLKGDNEVRQRCEQVLSQIDSGTFQRAVAFYEGTMLQRLAHTYLLAISEHGLPNPQPGDIEVEDELGRLSMWRAYGCGNGVALIFNADPIWAESDALGVYSNPVFYGSPNAFSVLFARVLHSIEQRMDEVKAMPLDVFEANLHRLLHFSSISTKHLGFEEEREWRITLSADPAQEAVADDVFNASSHVRREFRDVNGIPQRIYKVPFVDHPDEGLIGMTLPAILWRVIIGPTQYPMVVADAIVSALRKCGVENVHERVRFSGVPLRT